MFKSNAFAVGLISCGLILLGVSYAWNLIVPQEAVWSSEQALENADASAGLHEMTHIAAHSDISKDADAKKQQVKDELAAAQQRFETSRSDLDRARDVRQTTAQVLRWTGISIAVIGVMRYLAIRADHGQKRPSQKRPSQKRPNSNRPGEAEPKR